MLQTMFWILLSAILLSELMQFLHLPPLLGYKFAGILIGPFVLNLIDDSILSLSDELRALALMIILLRAGLSLHVKDFKSMGLSVFLLSMIPALLEAIGVSIFAYYILSFPLYEAMVLGVIIGAVSPAVIVPRMLEAMKKYPDKPLFKMILTSASLEDAIMVILFASLISTNGSLNVSAFAMIPFHILIGAVFGLLSGLMYVKLIGIKSFRDTYKVIMMIMIALFLLILGELVELLPYSPYIAIIVFGMTIQTIEPIRTKRLEVKYEKVWILAEMILFILMGAALDITRLSSFNVMIIVLLALGLISRYIGIWLSTRKLSLNNKEAQFLYVSFTPKATVQASLGPLPLALGFAFGHDILLIAIIAILITATTASIMMNHMVKTIYQIHEL